LNVIHYLFFTLLLAQTADTCPMHEQHMREASAARSDHEHGAAVDTRHDTFGMPHDGVRHSFRLLRTGGVIELQATTDDAAVTRAIREHLRSVAADFTKADFEKPLFVHGTMPEGVSDMVRLRGAIEYKFEELPRGGEVRISTKDPAALEAVHKFLKFQVEEHRTGDPGVVEP
jgi:TusA-related sulfurtransferase